MFYSSIFILRDLLVIKHFIDSLVQLFVLLYWYFQLAKQLDSSSVIYHPPAG